MEETQTLIRVVTVLAAILVIAWGCIGHIMRIAHKSAYSFAMANLLLLIGVPLTLRRLTETTYSAYQFADIFILGSFIVYRIGLQKLTFIKVTMREHLTVFVLTVLAQLLVPPVPEKTGLIAIIFSFGAGWTTFKASREAYWSLKGDFNVAVRLFCSLPFLMLFLTLVSRPVAAIFLPSEASAMVDIYGEKGGYFLWVQMVMMMLINISLIGIAIGRLFMKIQELAERDALTGVYNRRAIESRIRAERERFRRAGHACALAVFDLDFFKKINDELGHDGGDAALKHASAVITQSLRKTDVLGRFGGEEFLVVMPLTESEGAFTSAERMRALLEASPLSWKGRTVKITTSVGVATMTPSDADDNELFKRADEALYRAKANGRNRVEMETAPRPNAAG